MYFVTINNHIIKNWSLNFYVITFDIVTCCIFYVIDSNNYNNTDGVRLSLTKETMACIITFSNIAALPLVLLTIILSTSFDSLSKHSKPSDGDGKCELFGTFSLITQAILGFLCLSSLIAKRFYEYPIRRSWPVWFFDVSKQLIGALGVHIFNVLLSMGKSRDDDTNGFFQLLTNPGDEVDDDACDWYFLNIVLDCTIGVCILYFVFKYVNSFCQKRLKLTNIESGIYGDNPDHPSFRAYLKQLIIYCCCLLITKLLLYLFVEIFEQELLWITHNIILIWLLPYPDEFEIFIVMFIVPIVMNILQLILIDNFIQNQFTHDFNERLYDETDSVVAKEIENLMGLHKRMNGDNDNTNYGSNHEV